MTMQGDELEQLKFSLNTKSVIAGTFITKKHKKQCQMFRSLLSLLLCGSRVLKKIINFFGFRFRFRRLANRKKHIFPPGNYFKTLKDMITGTTST